MNIPFQPAAAPSPQPAFQKKLIVSDWGDTLALNIKGIGQPNKTLYLFLKAAHDAGHTVVIASRGDTQSIKDVLPLHGELIGIHMPDFQVERKETVANVMRKQGYEKADIIFDNDRQEVYGVHTAAEDRDGYIKAHFFGEVDEHGEVDSLDDLAVIIGIGPEFSQKLQEMKVAAPRKVPRLG